MRSYYHEPSYDFEMKNNSKGKYDFDVRLGGLPGLAFLGFLIYAVAVSHTDAVTTACGPSLWTYMLVRLVLSFFSFCAVVCIASVISMCFGSDGGVMPIIVMVLYTIFCATMLGVGTPIVSDAMNSPTCVSALSASCFTNSPMLAILGCIFIGIDALLLLVIVSLSFCFFCVFNRE